MKFLKIAFIGASLLTAQALFAGNVSELIEKAEMTRNDAAKSGFEWTTTAKLIKKAKKAAKAGDSELAIKLATKALKEGENSLIQAKYANDHWEESQPQ